MTAAAAGKQKQRQKQTRELGLEDELLQLGNLGLEISGGDCLVLVGIGVRDTGLLVPDRVAAASSDGLLSGLDVVEHTCFVPHNQACQQVKGMCFHITLGGGLGIKGKGFGERVEEGRSN